MSTGTYRSLAAEVGVRRAAIYNEIRRCLRLRGGSMVDGIKWIYKTCRELAGLLGVCIKTIERDLRVLVEKGWLEREKHDARWGKQHYYYRLGAAAPLSNGSRQPVSAEPDKLSASTTSNSTSSSSLPVQTAKNSQNGERSSSVVAGHRPMAVVTIGTALEQQPSPEALQRIRLGIEACRQVLQPRYRCMSGLGV